jgi:predicted lipoprotein with Yx(FWY)xxD motif
MRRVLVAISLAMGAAALAACGGGSSYSTSTGSTSAPTTAANSTAPASTAQQPVKIGQSSSLGPILTDANGRTLYVFLNDKAGSGKSACNGPCAQTWPPLAAPAGQLAKPDGLSGDLSVITRDDGTKELAYNGQPLYYYSKDSAPGDTNGQGVGSVWYTVSVTAAASSNGGTASDSSYGRY